MKILVTITVNLLSSSHEAAYRTQCNHFIIVLQHETEKIEIIEWLKNPQKINLAWKCSPAGVEHNRFFVERNCRLCCKMTWSHFIIKLYLTCLVPELGKTFFQVKKKKEKKSQCYTTQIAPFCTLPTFFLFFSIFFLH